MKKSMQKFGTMVFSADVMQERLPSNVYNALAGARQRGTRLSPKQAEVVAAAMKDWALEKGATHFTHWFQPMTGITAEKHDAFLNPDGNGKALAEFSGKELIYSESDASSFPSGGLRATFEARGYTAWDPTSYAFVKDHVLCIPTAFCSYGGEAMDTKTPLLRSMEAINRQGLRVLRALGDTQTASVQPMVGAEQEYFLIDKQVFLKRKDLIYTGRILQGSRPPKGQELDDHYFGAIKPRVAEFMTALNKELWRLGVPAKTEHNETAPAQHELACVYTFANVASDQNQLVMERMKRLADQYGMVCLLHEKPFAGVNGSGKHNNWSLSTDLGENLLNPGDTPDRNARFLLFLCAVIQAVDEYADLLRISVASAGNDLRLGGSEAPPSIVSVHLGDELTAILDALEKNEEYCPEERTQFKPGVDVLPRFSKDTTDRNRTSPFAFTGNKFEFRMVGSSDSVAESNIVINTAVADVLSRYADALESAEDKDAVLHELLIQAVREHRKVIFNGNGYDNKWRSEAKKRGLPNYPTTPDALPHLLDEKNVALFERNGVFSSTELNARLEILMDHYAKLVRIEGLTLLNMLRRDILPNLSAFAGALARDGWQKEQLGGADNYEKEMVQKISDLTDQMYSGLQTLEEAITKAENCKSTRQFMNVCGTQVRKAMQELRVLADQAEAITPKSYWPYPCIGDILFSI